MMKQKREQKRLIRKDAYLGVRMPADDKHRLESAAKRDRRNVSDLAWALIMKALDCEDRQSQEQTR